MQSAGDMLNYVLFDNPVSRGMGNFFWYGPGGCGQKMHHSGKNVKDVVPVESWTQKNFPLAGKGGLFLRIAGASGALAVCLGAVGAHVITKKDIAVERKIVFDTANRYHFLSSLALLAVPLARRPVLTGALFVVGTSIFSGTCYLYGFGVPGDYRRFTPYGGVILILAWLSFLL